VLICRVFITNPDLGLSAAYRRVSARLQYGCSIFTRAGSDSWPHFITSDSKDVAVTRACLQILHIKRLLCSPACPVLRRVLRSRWCREEVRGRAHWVRSPPIRHRLSSATDELLALGERGAGSRHPGPNLRAYAAWSSPAAPARPRSAPDDPSSRRPSRRSPLRRPARTTDAPDLRPL
jgi:hypothetical protein